MESVERHQRRLVRTTFATLGALALYANTQWLFDPVDLARGKPWRASSSWADCTPATRRCAFLVTDILFHTNDDDSPWFELDLGAPTRFSALTIENRKDDVPERARPLVVEVGDDAQTWRELLRHDEVFRTWKPRFPPQTARYIRVRIPRKTWLHLEAVKVHP